MEILQGLGGGAWTLIAFIIALSIIVTARLVRPLPLASVLAEFADGK